MGYSYLREQQLQPAYVEFQKAAELNPKDRDTHYALGHVYFVQGNYGPDLAQYNKGKVYLKRRQPDQALRAFSAALRINATHALAAFEAGRLYAEQGALKEAITAFEITVKQLPDFAEAHYHLAKTYAQAGMNEEARAAYRRVVELAPGSPWAEDANNHLARLRK
jgi:tetratricopeptide (TPR) repeat protein